MLNSNEAKQVAHEMLATGLSRADVFNQLLPQVQIEKKLAQAVAGYVSPETLQRHRNKLDWLTAIMVVQMLLGVAAIFLMFGLKPSAIIISILAIAWLSWIISFMRKGSPWGYTLVFLSSISSVTNTVETLPTEPISSSIGLAIVFGCIGFAFYVQHKINNYTMMFNHVVPGKKAKYAFLEEGLS